MWEAIQSSKPTFLSLPEWLTTPFRLHQASSMQQLLSCVASLPSLLEKARGLDYVKLNIEGTVSSPQKIWNSLAALLFALDTWLQSLQTKFKKPLYWTKKDEFPNSKPRTAESYSDPFPPLWFPNIWVANSLTHLWTFEVIIITEMKSLETLLGVKCLDRSPPKDVIEISTLICRSMEYLIQDSMRLYGPASTSLPLWTAKSAFKAQGTRCQGHLDWCQVIAERLLQKGFLVVKYQMGK